VRRRGTVSRKPGKKRQQRKPTRRAARPATSTHRALQEQVSALTRELAEAREQQTATAEVLQVISSSPGELRAVFEAMLANATRICGAKFGVLWLSEADGFRSVALHGAPPSFAEARRREPWIRTPQGTALGRVAATKQAVQVADIRKEPNFIRESKRFAVLELAGARTMLNVPMLKEDELVGRFVPLPISRSSWCKALPPKPSSPSRTRGCSTSCASARTISANRWNSRWPRRRFCASSAHRLAN